MGITGLWKIVEPTATEIPLECLEGKKLAIDVSIWIYQAQLAYPSDQPYPHLRLLVNRLSKLLFYKIRPVFVFDGPAVPPLKRQVLEARRQRKQNDDDLVKNPKKMKQLKEIAGGRLDDVALAKTIQEVISPSKKVILNDVYKDVPSTSTDFKNTPSEPQIDRLNYDIMSDSSEDVNSDDDDDIIVIPKKEEEPIRIHENPTVLRREKIQNLVEKRENMRNSRLHPAMIPEDSKNFSSFQLQRLLQRGRLNAEIDQLAKSSKTSAVSSADKINVTGPDGTRHVLQYAFADEIQQVTPTNSREIDSLYRPSALEMSLDLFNVQYGGKVYSREVTPDDVREEVAERIEERLIDRKDAGWQSKSGMLERIARRRVREHFGIEGGEEEEEEEEKRRKVDDDHDENDDELALQEALLASAAENVEKINPKVAEDSETPTEDVEWDPQRYDKPSTSSAHAQNPILKEYVHLNYEEDDKTPELYRDLQEFLTNCGIPWIEAPGEAEAQCVELERLGLVDGVVSDDSDVWAFGVRHVYRHMFSRNKRVQRYGERTTANRENCQLFCLQREDFISIALLSGGDYCPGLTKVGAIGALELVSEFVENRQNPTECLDDVEQRIMRLLSKVRHLFVTDSDEARFVSRNAMMMRRHVTEANEKAVIEMVCTNRPAVQAYLHPTVDVSSEKFRWRPMNTQLVYRILQQRLNWPDRSQRNEEKNSMDAFEKWNSFLSAGGVSQMRLDRFFAQKMDKSLELTWSKKVIEALQKIAKRVNGERIEKEEVEVVKEVKKLKAKQKAKTPVKRKSTRRGGGGSKSKKLPKKTVEALNLSEESSSNDSFDDDVV